MDHTVVLDRRAFTDMDLSIVAAQHRPRPNRTLSPDGDRTDDHRIGMHERFGMDIGHLITEGIDGHGDTVQAVAVRNPHLARYG